MNNILYKSIQIERNVRGARFFRGPLFLLLKKYFNLFCQMSCILI